MNKFIDNIINIGHLVLNVEKVPFIKWTSLSKQTINRSWNELTFLRNQLALVNLIFLSIILCLGILFLCVCLFVFLPNSLIRILVFLYVSLSVSLREKGERRKRERECVCVCTIFSLSAANVCNGRNGQASSAPNCCPLFRGG